MKSVEPSGAHASLPKPDSLSGRQSTAGSFRFWFADQRWEWSPEIFRMHGYAPGEIEPTTELLLAHKHPEDREHVAEAITRSVEHGEPFSSRHRFIDTHGNEHSVMVVADRILDTDEHPIGTSGFYIDLSNTLAVAEHEAVQQLVPDIVEARAAIERAKGVLMRMYQISEAQAFKVLVWRSQETNTKLRVLAEQLLAELPTLTRPAPAIVTEFDHVLLTLHERTPPD